jgi:hypothetical protein
MSAITKGPPGWSPSQIITNRRDGWVGSDPGHPPPDIAEAIARAMPGIGQGSGAADCRARMIERQAQHDAMMARRRARK